jgi:acetyltransferase
LIEAWRGPGDARLTLRPVLPQDAGPLDAMVRRISRHSRYNRFHAAVNGLTDDTLQRMTRVDHQRHLALVITARVGSDETLVADARYFVDESGDSAEFALLVDDRWQRRGLGLRAMRGLADAARVAGLRWLHGSVLASNTPMLALMRRCDFSCVPDRADAALVQVESALQARRPEPPTRWHWPQQCWAAGCRVAGAVGGRRA